MNQDEKWCKYLLTHEEDCRRSIYLPTQILTYSPAFYSRQRWCSNLKCSFPYFQIEVFFFWTQTAILICTKFCTYFTSLQKASEISRKRHLYTNHMCTAHTFPWKATKEMEVIGTEMSLLITLLVNTIEIYQNY